METGNQEIDYNYLATELNGGTDRAAAVIAGSFLEDSVKQLLWHATIDEAKRPEESISVCTKWCFQLGLISKFERDKLNCLQQVRNKFGHSPRALSFTDDAIAALCDQLQIPDHLICPQIIGGAFNRELPKGYSTPLADRSSPRAVFVEATMYLVSALAARTIFAKLRQPSNCTNFENAWAIGEAFLDHARQTLKDCQSDDTNPKALSSAEADVEKMQRFVDLAMAGAHPRTQ